MFFTWFRAGWLSLALLMCTVSAQASLGCRQLESGSQGMTLEFSFPDCEVQLLDGGTIHRFAGEGLLGQPGAPDLPLVNRLVEIPARAGIRLEILDEHWESLGSRQVRPHQDRTHRADEGPQPWLEDPSIFSVDAHWPEQWLSVSDPAIQRDLRLVKLGIAPLRWNPVSGEVLALRELSLRIHFEGENLLNALDHAPESPLFDAWHARNEHLLRMESEGALRDIQWQSATLPMNYLVIADTDAFDNDRFNDWLDWKRRKGHRIEILTEQDIPQWSRNAIRSAIADAYDSDTPPDYVTLVGDADGGSYELPTHFSFDTYGSEYDHFYSAIAGNDILADVVVGRLSARSSTQLSTICNKILEYELNPDLEDPSWLQRASFLTGTGHCGMSMKQLSRSIGYQLVSGQGYTQLDTAWCADSPNYVFSWYNSGISYHNYRGWVGMEGLNRTQVMAMNQGNRTPISVIFTCNSGSFADPNYEPAYSEAFLRAGLPTNPGGGAAAMGLCTQYTHTAYNNQVCGGFWSGLLDYGIRQVGTAMYRGKYELYMNLPAGDENIETFSNWANLMGDPGMNLWVGVPGVLQFDNLPEVVATDAGFLDLRVTDAEGQPVEGAAICLYQAGGLQLVQLSDASGRSAFPLDAVDTGQVLQITATRDNYVPALEDRSVQEVGGGLALLNALWDGGTAEELLPGSTHDLVLDLDNNADIDTPAGTLFLECEPGSAVVSPEVLAIDAIPAGGSLVSGILQVTLADSISDREALFFRAWHAAAGDTTELGFETTLSRPWLTVEDPDVDGLTLEPGDSDDLRIAVRNTGNRPASLTLTPSFGGSAWFSVDETPVELELNEGEASEQLVFEVTAHEEAWNGQQGFLKVNWTDSNGIRGHFQVALRTGVGTESEATGADAYGYFAIEDTDNHPLAPVYDWVEIAPEEGGPGTALELTDFADEQDDAALVDLPFPFRLYGEEYTQMGVCSNGFVSFGPWAHLETDFRNHYLPIGMGPEPMLAVMWDDHYLGGNTEVCTWYDETNHRYVVEWYRMRANSSNGINTFQLILLDPAHWPNESGEGEFIYQYADFDDTQDNDQDYPYCTIGLKDHTATRGMTLVNYNLWNDTATEIDENGGRAILFTVRPVEGGADGLLEELTAGLHFTLSDTETESARDTVWFHNAGEGFLNWSASVAVPQDWPQLGMARNTGRDQGGPDSAGYTWIDSEEEGGPLFSWIPVAETDTAVEFEHNDATAGPFALDFDFPFYGQLFDEFYINPNGWISFSDTRNLWYNAVGMPHEDAPMNSIAGWWDDLLNNEAMNDQVSYRAGVDSLVVSWVEAAHFDPEDFGGPFTFQIILERNGRITIQWADMNSGNPLSDSGTMGLQGPNDESGFVIHHLRQVADNYTVRVLPPFWLQLEDSGGIVPPMEDGFIVLHAHNAPVQELLPTGDYMAELRIGSASGGELFLPIGLSLGTTSAGETPSLPEGIVLGKAWPNPFNPVTTVPFVLPAARRASLDVYNIQGRKVLSLVESQELPAGRHLARFDGSSLASGVYFLRLQVQGESRTQRVLLLK